MDELEIDQITGVMAPLGKERYAAAREGHLCIRKEGDEGTLLQGDEERFEGLVGRWEDLVYLQKNWVLETRVIKEFKRLLVDDVKQIDIGDVGSLNQGQEAALKECLREGVSCLTGGPGTGKSYVIGEIIKRWGKDVCALAPTGKAVSLLREKLDVEVGTLHRLLNIRDTKELLFGGKPLEYGMVIIDECSMIDVAMWAALLKNIKTGTRLILVGDQDQLPPVEAGTVFGELCHFMKQRGRGYAHLSECMRSDRKEILEMAEAVSTGKMISYEKLDRDLKKWHQKGYQFLSCLRKGPFGTDAINEEMWEGDEIPIMMTRSDRKKDLSNGEMGVLIKNDPGRTIGKNDVVKFGEKEFPATLAVDFEPAYCISVHKSQGSEFNKVALLVPKGSEVFGREILYTGITRAKDEIVVLSEEGVLEECLEKTSEKGSGIRRRLCAL